MILIDLQLKQSQMAEHKVVSPCSSLMEGVPWKRAAVRLFAEDVLTGVLLFAGRVLPLCHTRLKRMLGRKCHIRADLFRSNMCWLIIVTVSQDTVRDPREFERCTYQVCKAHGAELPV